MAIQCELCPKYCVIDKGQSGECRIRVNLDDKLLAVTYNHPCAVHKDPMEKKPMFHFMPGTKILSLATVGCNLHCKNCQNWEISQANPEDINAYHIDASTISKVARSFKTNSIAYTYTEPLVYYEYTLGCAKNAYENGLKNVLVTAGYLNQKPLKKLLPFIHGANIDLKFMNDRLYKEISSATLKPVLETLILAKKMNVFVEVTNLVIPTLNDSDEDFIKITKWIKNYLGSDTPIHFSRFYPTYKLKNLPPTPPETLDRARNLAFETGLKHVYIGNLIVNDSENTYCSNCSSLLIERHRYTILKNKLKNGKCYNCNTDLNGVWV